MKGSNKRVVARVCSSKQLLESPGLCLARGFADDSAEKNEDQPSDLADVRTAGNENAVEDAEPKNKRRHGGRRYTRAEKGSWAGTQFVLKEGKHAPVWPANQPIYDLQTQAPFLFDRFNPVFEQYKALREQSPREFEKLFISQTEEFPPPREAASKILQWEVNVVFDMDPNTEEPHPLNKKVKCRVYLHDLQQEFNLSDDAMQLIALICGPRYNPKNGLLTLTSEKYRDREDNRLDIVDMLTALVKEGQEKFPSTYFKDSIDLKALVRQYAQEMGQYYATLDQAIDGQRDSLSDQSLEAKADNSSVNHQKQENV